MTGALLCGGLSTRMGYKKQKLPIKNTTLILHMLNILKNTGCKKIIISGYDKKIITLNNNIVSIPDIIQKKGPVLGIYSILNYYFKNKETKKTLLILPIDMPCLNEQILTHLIISNKYDACHYKNNPLPLYLNLTYEKFLFIKQVVINNFSSLKNFLKFLKTKVLLQNFKKQELTNINNPKQWRLINNFLYLKNSK